jgi:hypothetical protein
MPEGLRSETSAPIAILDAKFSLVVRERVTRISRAVVAPWPPWLDHWDQPKTIVGTP